MKIRYFAKCRHGIEDIVGTELRDLGAKDVKNGFSGVFFSASEKILYKIVFSSLTASRILIPLQRFKAGNEDSLYKNSFKIGWESIFKKARTFSVKSTVSGSRIRHSRYAGLKLKDAIIDRIRKKTGSRPNVNRDDPDLYINLNIINDMAELSLDAAGHPMHKRGYREEGTIAPLNETLAAAILRISGWDSTVPLYDPMCGSGTFLAEALFKTKNLPSGYLKKKFGLFFLPEFNKNLWEEVKSEQLGKIKNIPEKLIFGSDIDKRAVISAKKNLTNIPEGKMVKISNIDFRKISSITNSIIISNLPYGRRLSKNENIEKLYRDFGDFLKKNCTGSRAFLLCGSTELVKKIGLKMKRKIPFFNGPLETRLVEIELY